MKELREEEELMEEEMKEDVRHPPGVRAAA